MPIISVVGRKQRKIRLLIGALYVILTLGALTMVYPFLLMVSTSFTSPVDQNEFRLIPRYLRDDAMLYRKYVEAKYNEDIVKYDAWFSTDYGTFEELDVPKDVNRKLVMEWRRFKRTLPADSLMLANAYTISKMTPLTVTEYRQFLRSKFAGSLDRLNQAYEEANESWMEVGMPLEDLTVRNFSAPKTRKYRDFLEFKRSQPAANLITVSVEGLFQDSLRLICGNIGEINKAVGCKALGLSEVHLPPRIPNNAMTDEWEAFIRTDCPVGFVRIDPEAAPIYRQFMQKKYHSTADFPMPTRAPDGGIALVDWIDFLANAVPMKYVELRSPEALFREYLQHEYKNVQGLNENLGTNYAAFLDVTPPYAANDWMELQENRRSIRREFVVRNYREIIEYIALHGRALLNTGILCLGMVLAILTVNPLCAYALSRFNLRSTYKILLFLLATMAFPAEVSAIPAFLLIKKLHLLGTYWALILPGIASGYSIFLLKGFFDSLPNELFEAAVMDGATEMQMYWKICIQLSKPVLAVIALGAFTAAYGSFMWAFLVCQNPKMWTLMVWLFQMQIWAPQFLVYAGLVLAAMPTLLVFIFCQNIIMRGIIIPSEK
jgi:ABC-type glycerol-3-phosphate transport system permease component